ncbi:MAG: hypothetical protein EOO65_03745 [Methanosarcinales archaeon]|nr:MAG: hypothetical protein EOO65_03745 [Methanosarcinales archaeon]
MGLHDRNKQVRSWLQRSIKWRLHVRLVGSELRPRAATSSTSFFDILCMLTEGARRAAWASIASGGRRVEGDLRVPKLVPQAVYPTTHTQVANLA